MEDGSDEAERAYDTGPEAPPARWSDAVLVARLRARDDRAPCELYQRLAPQLRREARRLSIQPGLREEAVSDVLRAVYEALACPGRDAPASLMAYAVRALYRRALLLEQLRRTREAPLEDALEVPAPEDDEWTERPGGSPAAPSAGRTAQPSRTSPVGRLATALAAQLTDDEQQLLVWLADHVPQRDIAAWRGATFNAMRGRILRARAKARRIVRQWVASRPPREQAHLMRVLGEGALLPPSTPTARGRSRRGASADSPGDSHDAAP